jgi:hypothetical protein
MKLSKVQIASAPLCIRCTDGGYDGEPDYRLVERARGWVHIGNNSVRCPGQGDDDTDDRGEPKRSGAGYVVGYTQDGDQLVGVRAETVTAGLFVSEFGSPAPPLAVIGVETSEGETVLRGTESRILRVTTGRLVSIS